MYWNNCWSLLLITSLKPQEYSNSSLIFFNMKIIFTIKVEGKHVLCTYNSIKPLLFLCRISILKIIISIAVVQALERGLERRVINFSKCFRCIPEDPEGSSALPGCAHPALRWEQDLGDAISCQLSWGVGLQFWAQDFVWWEPPGHSCWLWGLDKRIQGAGAMSRWVIIMS